MCSEQGQQRADGSFPRGRRMGVFVELSPHHLPCRQHLPFVQSSFFSKESSMLRDFQGVVELRWKPNSLNPKVVWRGRQAHCEMAGGSRGRAALLPQSKPTMPAVMLPGEQGKARLPCCPIPGRIPINNPSATLLSASLQPRQPHSLMAFAAAAISGLKTP